MCRPAILLAIVCKECGLEAERATKADGWLEDDGGGEEANIGLLLFNNIIVTLRLGVLSAARDSIYLLTRRRLVPVSLLLSYLILASRSSQPRRAINFNLGHSFFPLARSY